METIKKYFKATISNLIVALIYTTIIIFIIHIVFGNYISEAVSLINTISIEKSDNANNEIKFDINDMNEVKIKNYPQYGSQYGRLVIDSINVDLPLYFGDTLAILKKGIGHSSGSYFPR